MKHFLHSHTPSKQTQQRGFALIATISIMVLLVLIVVGMLALSTSETKKATSNNHQLVAQANARLALSIALAQLQEFAGPDQRITANSSITTSTGQQHLLGIWKSIGDGLNNVNDLQTLANTYRNSYANKERNDRFLGWLTSGNSSDTTNINFPDTAIANNFAPLVGKGSLGLSQDDTPTAEQQQMMVYAPLESISDSTTNTTSGGYAWAAFGENLKARINLPPSSNKDLSSRIASRAATPQLTPSSLLPGPATSSSPDISDKLVDTNNQPSEDLQKSFTYGSLNLAGTQDITREDLGHYFHDLSISAAGLLTDTKWGGLRNDLSLLSEQQTLPGTMELSGDPSARVFPEGPFWHDLTDYMRAYKPFSQNGLVEWNGNNPFYTLGSNWQEAVRRRGWQHRMPTLTKLLWMISFFGDTDPANASNSRLNIVSQPVIELWNPFNIPLQMPAGAKIQLKFFSFPVDLFARPNGIPALERRGLHWPFLENTLATERDARATVAYNLNFAERMESGEVILFSDGSNAPRLPTTDVIDLNKGLEIRGGIYSRSVGHSGRDYLIPSSSPLSIDFQPRDRDFYTDNYLIGPAGRDGSEYSYQGEILAAHSQASVASDLLAEGDSFSLSSTSINDPRPQLIVGVALRTEHHLAEVGNLTTSEQTRFPSHLFSPLTLGYSYTHNDNDEQLENSPYIFFGRRVTDYDDIHIALENDNGHLGRSHQAQGQTHVPTREIPIQPLTSMAQLQHAGLGHYAINHDFNPQTNAEISDLDDSLATNKLKPWHLSSFPYINQAFGNSFATPYTDQDQEEQVAASLVEAWSDTSSGNNDNWSFSNVNQPGSFVSRGKATYNGPLHDKSWKLNEALWDNWFISGMGDWTNPLVTDRRNLSEVINHFVNDTKKLANPNYSSNVETPATAQADIQAADGYKKVARYILNKNSFNINSTSIHAWKTTLGSLDLKAHDLPYLSTSNTLSDDKSNTGYAVSRFTLPNAEAVDATGNGNAYWQQRWQGARKLTDNELDKLAEQVVLQVKQRGPFLSLGEFINRRLTDNPAGQLGALQQAIEDAGINDGFKNDSVAIDPASIRGTYPNPAAISNLHTGTGAPGYITQADILMPIAPALTARCDTFTIRTYGESHDAQGKVLARAWCEATVQRSPEYVDPSNKPDTELYNSTGQALTPLSTTNQKFGRKFRVISFKWLNPKEV